MHPWEVVEVSLTAAGDMANSYLEALPDTGTPHASLVFEGPRGQRLRVAAFWDGGREWKVRFAAPEVGRWKYRSESADSGLAAKSGEIVCIPWSDAELAANPARRGFLRVSRNGRHFEYADGTPFLWIGDTWWAWYRKGIKLETFQKLADDRAAKGFTVGQLFFPVVNNKPDLDSIRNIERMIAYANSRGITVWIHPWWSGKDFATRVGAENCRRWWRYVIHRLGAYNVIWTLAGEYNMNNYGGMGLPFWKDLGAMIRREDPWRRLIGAHPTPPQWSGGAEAPQWSTAEVLHNERWLDYNQSQVGHGRWCNEMIPEVVASAYARQPAKPIVVTEPWYEFTEGSASGEDVRFAAWSAMLNGAAGHTYGGGHIWWAHVPEAPSSQGPWPLHKEFDTDTLNYPGAVSMSVLAGFFKGMDWWKLAPHPELIGSYPSRYCTAEPGKRYVVFARWGGTLRLDLRAAAAGDTFDVSWLDLTNGRTRAGRPVAGGGVREFNAPEQYPAQLQAKDWVLHVRKR